MQLGQAPLATVQFLPLQHSCIKDVFPRCHSLVGTIVPEHYGSLAPKLYEPNHANTLPSEWQRKPIWIPIPADIDTSRRQTKMRIVSLFEQYVE